MWNSNILLLLCFNRFYPFLYQKHKRVVGNLFLKIYIYAKIHDSYFSAKKKIWKNIFIFTVKFLIFLFSVSPFHTIICLMLWKIYFCQHINNISNKHIISVFVFYNAINWWNRHKARFQEEKKIRFQMVKNCSWHFGYSSFFSHFSRSLT